MRTGDLIAALAADAGAPAPRMGLRLIAAALGGAGVSFAILLLFYGLRPGLGDAMLTWRVAVKFAAALTLAITGAVLALRLSRPLAVRGAWLIVLPAPLIAIAAVLGELAMTPPSLWLRHAVGHFSTACIVSVPLLAALPLAAILLVLRDGAPAVPAQAGAAAGAMAAGIGAAIYAMHCPDDSPLFLALWYGMAALAVTLAGFASGRRLLRW